MNLLSDRKQAAAALGQANRVLVIGCSGGGKSTLAGMISSRFDLPFISMDREFFWLSGWVERSRLEQRALIAESVARERWIMDGNNSGSFDLRLPRTDLVIWVRLPRILCIWGAVTRWLKWRGRTRPEMAPGCTERVDLEFLSYIWNYEKRHAPFVIRGLAAHSPDVPVVELKSRRDVRELLDSLEAQS